MPEVPGHRGGGHSRRGDPRRGRPGHPLAGGHGLRRRRVLPVASPRLPPLRHEQALRLQRRGQRAGRRRRLHERGEGRCRGEGCRRGRRKRRGWRRRRTAGSGRLLRVGGRAAAARPRALCRVRLERPLRLRGRLLDARGAGAAVGVRGGPLGVEGARRCDFDDFDDDHRSRSRSRSSSSSSGAQQNPSGSFGGGMVLLGLPSVALVAGAVLNFGGTGGALVASRAGHAMPPAVLAAYGLLLVLVAATSPPPPPPRRRRRRRRRRP